MPKGLQRGNREVKKPKQVKKPTSTQAVSLHSKIETGNTPRKPAAS